MKTSNPKQSIVFPGQGSQVVGMGEELFPQYRDYVSQANDILGYSLEELCLKDPDRTLNKTNYTQPALFTVSALAYMDYLKTGGGSVQYFAGHSLGEYSALYAAGAFSFEDGLRIVQKRGALMANAQNGSMAAILNIPLSKLNSLLHYAECDGIDIANINAPDQIVIAGPKEQLQSAEQYIVDEGGVYIPLNVSAPFHSRYMRPVAEEFRQFIEPFKFGKLQSVVLSNVTARPHDDDSIKQRLVEQLYSPVEWVDSVRFFMGKGIMEYKEIGPGNVLTKLVSKIQNQCDPLIVQIVAADKGEKNLDDGSLNSQQPLPSNKNLFIVSSQNIKKSNFPKGSPSFREAYHTKYNYVVAGLGRGGSTVAMIERAAKAGFLAFYGAKDLSPKQLSRRVQQLIRVLPHKNFGVNIYYNTHTENDIISSLLLQGISAIELSGYYQVTPDLVRYRLKGIASDSCGRVYSKNKIMLNGFHGEVIQRFLSPAPQSMVQTLLSMGEISSDQAELAMSLPMADDITIASDSRWTHQMIDLSAALSKRNQYRSFIGSEPVRMGAEQNIATPEDVAQAFAMGADYIVSRHINQSAIDSGYKESVKQLLLSGQEDNLVFVPNKETFEKGGEMEVLNNRSHFPLRANKLFSLWRNNESINDLDSATKYDLEKNYFEATLDDVLHRVCTKNQKFDQKKYKELLNSPGKKMTAIFKYYWDFTENLTLAGDERNVSHFQMPVCRNLTRLNHWLIPGGMNYSYHVDEIGEMLLQ